MPGDPWRIFREDPGRSETLKILWPAMYECLADVKPSGRADNVRCTLGVHPTGQGPKAAGRIVDSYGPPACGPCIERIHGKGHKGWPIMRERVTK